MVGLRTAGNAFGHEAYANTLFGLFSVNELLRDGRGRQRNTDRERMNLLTDRSKSLGTNGGSNIRPLTVALLFSCQ